MGTWNAYGNQYWPADYLIDATGHVRYAHFGEGDYDEDRNGDPRAARRSGQRPRRREPPERRDRAQPRRPRPETYLGTERAQGWIDAPEDRARTTTARPPTGALALNDFAFSGTLEDRRAAGRRPSRAPASTSSSRPRTCTSCSARPAARPRRCRCCSTGARSPPAEAGADVHGGVVTVRGQRLYTLVSLPHDERHRLSLRFAPGRQRLRVHVRAMAGCARQCRASRSPAERRRSRARALATGVASFARPAAGGATGAAGGRAGGTTLRTITLSRDSPQRLLRDVRDGRWQRSWRPLAAVGAHADAAARLRFRHVAAAGQPADRLRRPAGQCQSSYTQRSGPGQLLPAWRKQLQPSGTAASSLPFRRRRGQPALLEQGQNLSGLRARRARYVRQSALHPSNRAPVTGDGTSPTRTTGDHHVRRHRLRQKEDALDHETTTYVNGATSSPRPTTCRTSPDVDPAKPLTSLHSIVAGDLFVANADDRGLGVFVAARPASSVGRTPPRGAGGLQELPSPRPWSPSKSSPTRTSGTALPRATEEPEPSTGASKPSRSTTPWAWSWDQFRSAPGSRRRAEQAFSIVNRTQMPSSWAWRRSRRPAPSRRPRR